MMVCFAGKHIQIVGRLTKKQESSDKFLTSAAACGHSRSIYLLFMPFKLCWHNFCNW